MANVLGTLSSALIVQTALDMIPTERPALQAFTTDFSQDAVKKDQQILSRIIAPATVADFPATAQDRADVDVPVTIDQCKEIAFNFTYDELNQTDRDLVGETAQPIAEAIAEHFIGAVAGLWTPGNFASSSTEAVADVDYQTFTALRKAVVKGGSRFSIVNPDVYEKCLNDTTIIDASKNPKQDAIHSGVIRGVAGFDIYEYDDLPSANNLIGFAGRKDSSLIASRAPLNPETVFGPGAFPGVVNYVTNPETGLTVMVVEQIDAASLDAKVRVIFQYGVAKGNTDGKVGRRLISA
jgi:hypothetical protein